MCSKPKIEMPAAAPAAAPAPPPVEAANKQTDVATSTERKKGVASGKNKLTISRSAGTGLNI